MFVLYKYRQQIYFSIKCALNGNNAGANAYLTTPVACDAYSAVSLFDSPSCNIRNFLLSYSDEVKRRGNPYKQAIFNEKIHKKILKRY